MTLHPGHRKHLLVAFILLTGLLLSVIPCRAEGIRIAIFPFEINAPENLDYLQKGIFQMLANRLGTDIEEVEIIPQEQMKTLIETKPAVTVEDKVRLARSLKADYFATGSITAIGNTSSTDAQFFSVQDKEPLVRFSETGTQPGDVITHIDHFASRINGEVISKEIGASGVSPSAAPAMEPKAAAPAITGLKVTQAAEDQKDRWQSDPFATHLKGVAVVDIDGDGANETVTIDENKIYVHRYEDGRFTPVAEFQKSRFDQYLGLDAADINANGRAEIFISNYGKLSERPASFILEFDSGSFTLLEEDAARYYRVVFDANRQPVLLAQSHAAEGLFSRNIHRVGFEKGSYPMLDLLNAPKNINLFDLTPAWNSSSGAQLFVAYVLNHEIAVLSASGKMLWRTEASFDGSLNYFEYTDYQKVKHLHYLPQRILITDTDDNGKMEVIAVKNEAGAFNVFSNFKRYKNGRIACLEWHADSGLQTKWETLEAQGYISDLAFADATSDGKPDLVFTVVQNAGAGFKKPSSTVVIQQLP
jgi:hypothetical protein